MVAQNYQKKRGKVAHVDRTREPGGLAAADSDALRNQIKHSLGRLISSFGLIRHRLPKRHILTQSMTFMCTY